MGFTLFLEYLFFIQQNENLLDRGKKGHTVVASISLIGS